MNRAAVVAALRKHRADLQNSGATGLYMFGSRARGDDRPESDLDLFIDYDADAKVPSIFRLMQLEEELGRVLGVEVSITTRNAPHPLMRERIEQDSIRVL